MANKRVNFLTIYSLIASSTYSINAIAMELPKPQIDPMDVIELDDKTTRGYQQAVENRQITPLKRRFLEQKNMTIDELFGNKKAFEDHLEKAFQGVLEEEDMIPDEGEDIEEK